VRSALFGDLPVLAGYLVYVGLVFVIVNALVDLACHLLDPR
jgi:ABC-type dipeptide/oligopeptide/nickel transport system permease component